MKAEVEEPPEVMGYQMDPQTPLHRLFVQRMERGRDLKVIITANNSETGVGKTTCAGWLALSWMPMYAGEPWTVEDGATLSPKKFFKMQRNSEPGSVLILDDAEELDARRSMQSENVKFSQRWMLMRVLQQIHILTLPSPGALDSRLEELADVWLNIERRGKAVVHDIRTLSYGSRKVITEKVHNLEFPDVSEHEELKKLDKMKRDKIDKRMKDQKEEEETPDPEEVERETKVDIAQKLRDSGMTVRETADKIGMSKTWVSSNTTRQVKGVQN